MSNHIEGRNQIIDALRRELVGPSPVGEPLDTSGPIVFDNPEDSYGPWVEAGTGQEILQRDAPTKRYGIGVLYPRQTPMNEADDDPTEDHTVLPEPDLELELPAQVPSGRRRRPGPTDSDDDDFDLSRANDYRPSCAAVSFLIDPTSTSELSVHVTGGRYRALQVLVGVRDQTHDGELPDDGDPPEDPEDAEPPEDAEKARDSVRTWWVRSDVRITAEFDPGQLAAPSPQLVPPTNEVANNTDGLELEFRAYARPRSDGSALVTVALVNRCGDGSAGADKTSLFQLAMRVSATSPDGSGAIRPYPSAEMGASLRDEEQESFDLLYRHCQTFAAGHGCAADWENPEGRETVAWVSAEPLPAYEAPSITPEVVDNRGNPVRASMARLAGLDASDGWLADCRAIVEHYRSWIDLRRAEAARLPPQYLAAANRHLEQCEDSAKRIEEGIELLDEDAEVAEAFKLANHAILLQQLSTRPTPRAVTINQEGRFTFGEPFVAPEWTQEPDKESDRGYWRPFQIAFLLSALASVADPTHPDRRLVELIWFPTGGGKTEAYLGLSAFCLFLRRLRDPSDNGTEILMRYTLRLLTTQQLLRASALVCAMEHLRAPREDSLGSEPFTIGVWLGGGATPNTRRDAKSDLRALNANDRFAENPFLLLRCPSCSAQMGLVARHNKAPRHLRVAGYKEQEGTVVLHCPDPKCEFFRALPVLIIDEDIYERPPSMVIGTVDKFALLAWKPEARALFGLDAAGSRHRSPPGLVIQDELHLISGPLGSMVGLYEAIIESLCTDTRNTPAVPPKIVSSTATIRRYGEQIQALYGRDRVALFPAPGLHAGDSFFARYDTDDDGSLRPGRVYLGVHGSGLGSTLTAQVRTFAALLQAPVAMSTEQRDPWWTLLVFFNSLRELGTSVSLAQSDIRDYLRVLQHRHGLNHGDLRRIRILRELTGRLRRDDVPKAIDELSRPSSSRDVIDMCLASNIIEVGVDIDRLSLLCVVGQPKSTSQYIQVTGRIGRRWRERPGLVVTILSPSKPRDRSHYERFRSYHERLYAQVEPTSVTPFAPPVLDRALHAVLCSHARQSGPENLKPWPVPDELISEAVQMLDDRVKLIDPDEAAQLERTADGRVQEWRHWERTDWTGSSWSADGRAPLLRRADEWVPPDIERVTWPTPTSMRNVDAQCISEVTNMYAADQEQPE